MTDVRGVTSPVAAVSTTVIETDPVLVRCPSLQVACYLIWLMVEYDPPAADDISWLQQAFPPNSLVDYAIFRRYAAEHNLVLRDIIGIMVQYFDTYPGLLFPYGINSQTSQIRSLRRLLTLIHAIYVLTVSSP
jgi:hypothetical protein